MRWPSRTKSPAMRSSSPANVALYLGEGRYIHSTGAAASGGVVINSLEPSDRCIGRIW